MNEYTEDELKYIKECLANEEKKPSGMFGLWAYYAMKQKEYATHKKKE